MTLHIIAFAMPLVTLAFIGLLTYGVARYNKRPVTDKHLPASHKA
jgi:hypothetical protein